MGLTDYRAQQPDQEGLTTAQWNSLYPVGTRVVAYPGQREADHKGPSWALKRILTVTRTPAWTLGHGAAVVSVEGYAGGIALTHVDVLGGVS